MSTDINSGESDFHDPAIDQESNKLEETEALRLRPSKRIRFFKEAMTLITIGFLVIVFRSVFFEPFKIPTGSMIPSLRIGDFILVNKFAYGFKVPFSDMTIGSINLDPIYLFGEKKVERGDVIVFKYPKDPSINYIKRVIALPGETIEIKNKKVFINGSQFDEEKLENSAFMKNMDEKFKDNKLAFYRVTLKEKNFDYQVDEDNFFKVDYAKRKIPVGHYFVMGDNRDFSYDSRYWGVVPHENIKGQAFLVWLSINVSENSEESFSLRSERIGELIR